MTNSNINQTNNNSTIYDRNTLSNSNSNASDNSGKEEVSDSIYNHQERQFSSFSLEKISEIGNAIELTPAAKKQFFNTFIKQKSEKPAGLFRKQVVVLVSSLIFTALITSVFFIVHYSKPVGDIQKPDTYMQIYQKLFDDFDKKGRQLIEQARLEQPDVSKRERVRQSIAFHGKEAQVIVETDTDLLGINTEVVKELATASFNQQNANYNQQLAEKKNFLQEMLKEFSLNSTQLSNAIQFLDNSLSDNYLGIALCSLLFMYTLLTLKQYVDNRPIFAKETANVNCLEFSDLVKIGLPKDDFKLLNDQIKFINEFYGLTNRVKIVAVHVLKKDVVPFNTENELRIEISDENEIENEDEINDEINYGKDMDLLRLMLVEEKSNCFSSSTNNNFNSSVKDDNDFGCKILHRHNVNILKINATKLIMIDIQTKINQIFKSYQTDFLAIKGLLTKNGKLIELGFPQSNLHAKILTAGEAIPKKRRLR